jgi:hypothetical protein
MSDPALKEDLEETMLDTAAEKTQQRQVPR